MIFVNICKDGVLWNGSPIIFVRKITNKRHFFFLEKYYKIMHPTYSLADVIIRLSRSIHI